MYSVNYFEVAEDLAVAKTLLQTVGWGKQCILSEDGHFCAVGALIAAVGVDPYADDNEDNAYDRRRDAENVLRACLGEDVPVPIWNDRIERTETDVIKAFDKAIALSLKKANAAR